MKKHVLNRRGVGYIFPCIIILVVAMVLSIVLFYANTMTIIETTKENTRLVLDGFVAKNAIVIFDSIKNGNDFTENIDGNLYVSSLLSNYKLHQQGNILYAKDDNGNTVYRMTCPNVDFEYANTLKLRAMYTVIVPVNFAGHHLFDLYLSQKVTSYYNLK